MNTGETIYKIKNILNINTTEELGKLLGVSGAAIRKWVKKGEIPKNNIFRLRELVGITVQLWRILSIKFSAKLS